MRPLVPVLLAFVSGIIMGARLGLSLDLTLLLLAISLIPLMLSVILGLRFRHAAAVLPFMLLGSLFILPYVRPELPACHIKNFINGGGPDAAKGPGRPVMAVEGAVSYPPRFANGRTKLRISVERVFRDKMWMRACGEVLLTANGHEERFLRGDRLRFIARLAEPVDYGNPGGFDYRWYLNERGIFVTGYLKDRGLIEKIGQEGAGAAGYIDLARSRIADFIDRSGVSNGGLIKAVIVGDAGGVAPGIRDAFEKTGTVHILVIAGLHVGFVALFAYRAILFLLKRSERVMLSLNVKKAAALLTVPPVAAYGLIAGFPVSTERAVIMVTAFTASFLFNRGKDLYNTLALAALLILLAYPYSIWDASFQLSFAAVFFIVYLTPRLEEMLVREDKAGPLKPGLAGRLLKKRLIPAFSVTLAASLGTAPLLAYHFHRVSAVGLAANLVAVPLAGLALPFILSSVAILPFLEWPAAVLLHAASAVFGLMAMIIEFFSRLPYASVWVATPSVAGIALFYSLVLCAANVRRSRVCAYLAPVIVLAMLMDWGWWTLQRRFSRELRVTYLNMGRGESEIVEFPGGKVMLMDAGERRRGYDEGERIVAPALWSKGISRIDYLVLSRTGYGDMAALGFIARNFGVKEFWWNGDGSLGTLGGTLSANNARIRAIDSAAGMMNIGGATVEALNPAGRGEGMPLVLRIAYGSESFLFTGGIKKYDESELMKRDVRAAVLEAPGALNRGPSPAEFLQSVSPSIVVVGGARQGVYGRPGKEAVERYGLTGAKVLSIAGNGAITLVTDGKGMTVK